MITIDTFILLAIFIALCGIGMELNGIKKKLK